MSHTSWITGKINPLGIVVYTADTCFDPIVHFLRKLGCLIHKKYVCFCALKLVQICYVAAIAKRNDRSVFKGHIPGRFLIGGYSMEQRNHWYNMILPQLRIGTSHNHNTNAWVMQSQQCCLYSHCPAFTAASGAAKGNIAVGI